MAIRRYLFPLLLSGKKTRRYQLHSFQMVPRRCINASGHDFWFWDLVWQHRCHTVDTTSPYRPFSATNNSVARPYRWSCWSQNVLRICLHAFLSRLPPPYCGELLSELSPSFRQSTPSDVLAVSQGPIALVDGAPVTNIPQLGTLSSLNQLH
jgi:hypothetical protein